MKQTAILTICLFMGLLANSQERRPARILKPVPAPKKLIQLIQRTAEDEIDVNRLLGFYEKHVPGLVELLEQQIPADMEKLLRDEDDDEDNEKLERRREHAERLREIVEKMIEDFQDYQDLLEDEPKHARMALAVGKSEYACLAIALKIRTLREQGEQPNKDKIKALEDQLHAELGKLFDLKLTAQKEELKWMTEEVAELQRLIRKKEKYRKQIIEKKFLELTGELEDLEF